jgi:hypothetical protein
MNSVPPGVEGERSAPLARELRRGNRCAGGGSSVAGMQGERELERRPLQTVSNAFLTSPFFFIVIHETRLSYACFEQFRRVFYFFFLQFSIFSFFTNMPFTVSFQKMDILASLLSQMKKTPMGRDIGYVLTSVRSI